MSLAVTVHLCCPCAGGEASGDGTESCSAICSRKPARVPGNPIHCSRQYDLLTRSELACSAVRGPATITCSCSSIGPPPLPPSPSPPPRPPPPKPPSPSPPLPPSPPPSPSPPPPWVQVQGTRSSCRYCLPTQLPTQSCCMCTEATDIDCTCSRNSHTTALHSYMYLPSLTPPTPHLLQAATWQLPRANPAPSAAPSQGYTSPGTAASLGPPRLHRAQEPPTASPASQAQQMAAGWSQQSARGSYS